MTTGSTKRPDLLDGDQGSPGAEDRDLKEALAASASTGDLALDADLAEVFQMTDEQLAEELPESEVDASMLHAFDEVARLHSAVSENDARVAMRGFQLPSQAEFLGLVENRIVAEECSVVRAVALELLGSLEDAGVLDPTRYQAGRIRYEVHGLLKDTREYFEKDTGATLDKDSAEKFVVGYLAFGLPVFLKALESLVESALSESERLNMHGLYLKERRETGAQLDALQDKASIDPLTQLWNRTAYYEHIDTIQDEDPNGLYFYLMLDLDKFGSVNNTYGHSFGDEVLQRFGTVLRNNVRGGTHKEAFRIGGEEMVVLCKVPAHLGYEKAERIAMQRAEQIRAEMEKELFHCDGVDHKQTVSIGAVICLGSQIGSSEGAGPAYTNSDAALYEAKEGGRNQVRLGERALGDAE